jgi:hypothetical protein
MSTHRLRGCRGLGPEKGRRSVRAPAGRLPGRLLAAAIPHSSSGAPGKSFLGSGEAGGALLVEVS